MSGHAWLLIAWVVVGAAVLIVHAVVLAEVWVHAKKLDWRWKLAAIVPFVAPIAAWLDGRRVAPVLWLVLVIAYAGLRIAE